GPRRGGAARALPHRLAVAVGPDVGHAVRRRAWRDDPGVTDGPHDGGRADHLNPGERRPAYSQRVGRSGRGPRRPIFRAGAQTGRMPGDPLELDRDTMRSMGYRVVDLLVERIATLGDGPVLRTATRTEMQSRLAEPAPAKGRDFDTLLDRLATDVLPY